MQNCALTCICYTVVFTISPHVINDDDPHKWGADNAADDHHHNNANCCPSILTVYAGHRVTVGRGWDAEVDMTALCAERVGHDAHVFPCISRAGIYDYEKLIGCGEEVTFRQHQRGVVFGPVEAGGGATTSYALEDSSLTSGNVTVL